MKTYCRAACGLLLFASLLSAQTPPAAPKAEATPEWTEAQKNARLDQILDAWEKRMSDVKAISMLVTSKYTGSLRGDVETMTGVANIQKPNQALLHLEEKGNPGNFKRFLMTGKKIYDYQPRSREIKEYDMPKEAAQNPNLFFSILSGMKAKEARERFAMRYQREVGPYAYIDFFPKNDSDKQEFTAARLVMVIDGKKFPDAFMLPRQVYYIAPNQDTQMYDLDQIKINVKFAPANFQLEKPKDWKVVPALSPTTLPSGTVPGNPAGPGSLMKGIKETKEKN